MQIKWDRTNIKHSDHLTIHYSRDGGASWFRIAQDIPAFTFGYWWQVDNFPTTQGRVKILLQEDLVDHRPERRQLHCAAQTTTSRSSGPTAEKCLQSGNTKTSTGADKIPAATPLTLITAPTTALPG